jgi:radical SAM superfamily enzyme YgiQ (UPF0313 family)
MLATIGFDPPSILESQKGHSVELPRRTNGDRYTPPGRYRELETQVRRRAVGKDIPILFFYAFDRRTRLGPFIFCDSLVPGAPRAIAASLHAAGMTNTRIVLQQWSPQVRPSAALIDGKRPEILMISAMQIHGAAAYDLVRDAWSLESERPLIITGGAKAIFEPWDFFGLSEDGRVGADVVLTGEEFVLMELLDRILEHKGANETMRQAFERVRAAGFLEDIPGLVYRPDAPKGPPTHLVNTGIQRLVQDLDELPLTIETFKLFEPPHRRATLSAKPMPARDLHRCGDWVSLVTTHGCKFRCPYCPIPGYNQHTFRTHGAEKLVDEIKGIVQLTGLKHFFGTDDNFFNDRPGMEAIFGAMARAEIDGKPLRKTIAFATEGTEFDVHKNRDLLPLARDAGLSALFFGIEDMTAELVQKGQSPEKTQEVFRLLIQHGIAPMPMMMYHDGQPLWSREGLYGLLNQVSFLRKAGALTCQVTLLTPSVGSRSYEEAFRDGTALKSVNGCPVEEYQYDGNHCVATGDPRPWRRQVDVWLSYLNFYNPLNLLKAAFRFDPLWQYRVYLQIFGMIGVAQSVWRARKWFGNLVKGPIERHQTAPGPKYPMIAPPTVDTRLIHHGEAADSSEAGQCCTAG